MCDTFCVRRPDGMLFAKSSDRPIDEVQLLHWFRRRPPGDAVRTTYQQVADSAAAAVLGSKPTWMWGLEHGVNEHGVAIGNEKVWTVDDPSAHPPALLGMDLVRLGLERAATADGALDVLSTLLAEHGQGGSGEEHHDEPYWSSFLVVDRQAGWVLETSGRSWVAQPVGDGAAISNRLTLSTGWSRSSPDVRPGTDWDDRRDPRVPTGIADHRLTATRACVRRAAAATPADAVAVLRDHGTGPWGAPGRSDFSPAPVPAPGRDDGSDVTVCMHVRGYQGTTASMVAELPADPSLPPRVWASLGNPCVGVFLPVGLWAGDDAEPPFATVPTVLADAEVWRRLATLSRRVEAPGDAGATALTEVRGGLDAVEADAWAEGDALWAAGADRSAWNGAASRWDTAVREGLTALG